MPDKLSDQSAIAADGIKQLVEQGRKTLTATEQVASLLSRMGPSSPAAHAFFQAGISGQSAGTRSQASAVQQAVQSGIGQVQAASQPRSAGPSVTSLKASMMQSLPFGLVDFNTGESAKQPYRPGIPLGQSQWPAGMPSLPGAASGSPAGGNMPPLPGGSEAAAGVAGAAAGGGMGAATASLLRIGGGVGLGYGFLKSQFAASPSSGHGISQWLKEGEALTEQQISLGYQARTVFGMVDNIGEQAKSIGLWHALSGQGIGTGHFESHKTSVGNGPK